MTDASLTPPASESGPSLPIGARGSTYASDVIWSWRPVQPHGHEAAALRTKGALRALVGFVAAGLLGWLGHPIVAAVAAGISLLTLVLAIVSPLGGYRLMQRGIATAGRGAGIFIGWLTLVPVFLLFFVPFGIVFRRGRKDPMRRNMSSTAPTYWRTRTADTDALERRKRLF